MTGDSVLPDGQGASVFQRPDAARVVAIPEVDGLHHRLDSHCRIAGNQRCLRRLDSCALNAGRCDPWTRSASPVPSPACRTRLGEAPDYALRGATEFLEPTAVHQLRRVSPAAPTGSPGNMMCEGLSEFRFSPNRVTCASRSPAASWRDELAMCESRERGFEPSWLNHDPSRIFENRLSTQSRCEAPGRNCDHRDRCDRGLYRMPGGEVERPGDEDRSEPHHQHAEQRQKPESRRRGVSCQRSMGPSQG